MQAYFTIYSSQKNMKGETPLHLACKNGNIQLVEMLMERSDELDINLNEKTGNTGCLNFKCIK